MRVGSRSGFTLIELVIAAFIFAVGVLALEATAASSLRRLRRSADLSLAAAVARSRLEALAAARCTALASGNEDIRGVASSWTIEATPLPSVWAVSQTVVYALDGRLRTDTYRAMINCSE
ncbi:MAG: prepilin-type N-terminal cleavage/methylation domain-containing protein [Gemmatimonadaceae bacterium]